MRFTLGNVFGLCFSVMGKRFWPLLGVVVILAYGLSAISLAVTTLLGTALHIIGSPLLTGISMLVSYVSMAAVWTAVTEITLLHVAQKEIPFGTVLRNAFVKALPVLLIGILWFVGFMVGLMVFIIPGTIFAIIFSVTVPAFIEEKTGIFGAFSRSRALTKGHRWGIFGMNLLINISIYLVFIVGAVVLGMLLGVGNLATADHDNLKTGTILILTLLGVIVFTALYMLVPVLNTSLYAVLRADKGEPIGTTAIENIF